MIPFMGGTSSPVARRCVAFVARLAGAAWRASWRAARRDAVALESLAGARGLSAAQRRALRCVGREHRERFIRACEDGRRVQVGARLDRAEFARALSRASREARGWGAIYHGVAELAPAAAAEAVDAESGVRLAPYDASSEPTYDASDDVSPESAAPLTPRMAFDPSAFTAGR